MLRVQLLFFWLAVLGLKNPEVQGSFCCLFQRVSPFVARAGTSQGQALLDTDTAASLQWRSSVVVQAVRSLGGGVWG